MSINFNKFEPRPGLVNKQGRLPDPYELVCIEVPKIFDQCLIKRCLVYGSGPDTITTDRELRSDPLFDPRSYIRSRDFNIRLNSVDKFPLRTNHNYKKLVIDYTISFYADYIDCDGLNRSEFYEINRTDTIYKFYCPDSIAQISAYGANTPAQDLDSSIIKLEMVAEALDGELVNCEGEWYLDITLGYFLIVKCELHVQLLVPAYGYCPVPSEACCEEDEPEEDVCERFWNSPPPQFYPEQNLQPLFTERDTSRNSREQREYDSDVGFDDSYDDY
ncbi:MAG: hypothetical protein GX339_08300 [Tissierellia bacterium]|nr:hypothetical protein [Tissierellia bacterium]